MTGLKGPAETWQAGGTPFTAMLVDDNAETHSTGQARPRIPPAHVDLDVSAYICIYTFMYVLCITRTSETVYAGGAKFVHAMYQHRYELHHELKCSRTEPGILFKRHGLRMHHSV